MLLVTVSGIQFFSFKNLILLLELIKDFQNEALCISNGCNESFRTVAALYSHFYRKHNSQNKPKTYETHQDHSYGTSFDYNADETYSTDDDSLDPSDNDFENDMDEESKSFHQYLLNYFLRLKDQMMLPETVAKLVIDETIGLMCDVKETLLKIVKENCKSEQDGLKLFEKIKKQVDYTGLHELSQKMSSLYRIKKNFSDKFSLLLPREIQMSPNSKAYYVSIEDNLKVILQNKSISDKVISNLSNKMIDKNLVERVVNEIIRVDCSEKHQCNVIRSYRDGEIFKNSAYRRMKSDIIDLILYTDEFGLCDALGKHDESNKAFCIYFTIGNKVHCNLKVIIL